jgi:hypothetical protein
MKDKIWGVSPITHTHHYIRFKPAVIPFLLLRGFEMSSMGVNAHFQESPV